MIQGEYATIQNMRCGIFGVLVGDVFEKFCCCELQRTFLYFLCRTFKFRNNNKKRKKKKHKWNQLLVYFLRLEVYVHVEEKAGKDQQCQENSEAKLRQLLQKLYSKTFFEICV